MNSRTIERHLYTVAEVCQRLRVSRATIYRWITDGQLDAFKVGGSIRISEQALAEFITTSTKEVK